MTPYEIFTSMVALLAVLISIIALYRNNQTARRQMELQEREAELREKQTKLSESQTELQRRVVGIEEGREQRQLEDQSKADLIARIVTEGEGGSKTYLLEIRNDGEADARQVEVIMDGKPLNQHPAFFKSQEIIRKVPRKSTIRYPLILRLGTSPPFDISVRWADDFSDSRGPFEGTLTA